MEDLEKVKKILFLFSKAKERSLQLELIELFFTDSELAQLVARYEIIEGLIEDKNTQRGLAVKLKLSIANITRGSNELKRCSSKVKTYLTNFFKNKE